MSEPRSLIKSSGQGTSLSEDRRDWQRGQDRAKVRFKVRLVGLLGELVLGGLLAYALVARVRGGGGTSQLAQNVHDSRVEREGRRHVSIACCENLPATGFFSFDTLTIPRAVQGLLLFLISYLPTYLGGGS